VNNLNLLNKNSINLDANASWGTSEEVWAELCEMQAALGSLNPSSIHQGGQRSRFLIEEARDSIKDLLSLKSADKLIFTSGATESNNTAIFSAMLGKKIKTAVVTSTIEHPSILEAAKKLALLDHKVVFVQPDSKGETSVDSILTNVNSETSILSLMLVNNETGIINPVSQIASNIQQQGISCLVHTDAVQALGKIPVSFMDLNVDLMSISGHKIGALAGVGALIVRDGLEIEPLLYGGPQEKRSRAGTENILGIVSFGIAAKILKKSLKERITKISQNREIFWRELRNKIPNILPNVDLSKTSPNTLSLFIEDVNTSDLVVALDLEGIYISSGAACASGKPGASHVLLGMGMSEERASQSIRISLKDSYPEEKLLEAAHKIISCIERIRG